MSGELLPTYLLGRVIITGARGVTDRSGACVNICFVSVSLPFGSVSEDASTQATDPSSLSWPDDLGSEDFDL